MGDFNIKKLLEDRERHYIELTEKILIGFFEPLRYAIETVIYKGDDVQLIIKSLRPIPENLNYININISCSNFKPGDNIPIEREEGLGTKRVKITEENFWEFADTINLNVPINILETQDRATITEYVKDVYENKTPIPLESPENDAGLANVAGASDTEEVNSSDGKALNTDGLGLDKTQRSLYNLYNNNSKTRH